MKIISLSLPLYITLKFYRNSKKNKIISFISTISIISTSLGIAILIICLSAINGFNKELNKHILSIIPHGQIEPINSKFSNWPIILNKIKNIPEIIQATPYIHFPGLITQKDKFQPIQVYGTNTLYDIHPKITNFLSSSQTIKHFSANKKIIVLGKGAAHTLQLQKNDWIQILIHQYHTKKNLLYEQINLKIIDILDLKSYLDHNIAFIPLLDAQNYTNQIKNISGINIKVSNIFHVAKVLQQAKKIINERVSINSWINTYKNIYQDIQMIRIIVYLTMTLVITIASFSIISILTLTIKEKNRDIAILRTLGSEHHLIYSTFILYGLLNSFISIFIGGSFGILISIYLTEIYNLFENIFQCTILHNNSYFINFLPSELHIQDLLSICSIEILLSFLATLYPAIYANQISPAKVLK